MIFLIFSFLPLIVFLFCTKCTSIIPRTMEMATKTINKIVKTAMAATMLGITTGRDVTAITTVANTLVDEDSVVLAKK